METQKLLKNKDEILVVSDYREREVAEHLKKIGATVNEKTLSVGDFVCSEEVVVERKSHSDFISSIIDGRVFEQADFLKKSYKKPVIVIEGYSNRQINDNVLKAAMASLIVDFDVSLISTKNTFDTAKIIFWLAKKEQTVGRGISIKVGKKPKEMKKLQEFIVASIPGISTVLAKRLLEKFGSIEKIVEANISELEKIVGKKKSEAIGKVLTEKYQ
jgi:Fanconi anemia group M protein